MKELQQGMVGLDVRYTPRGPFQAAAAWQDPRDITGITGVEGLE